MASTEPIILGIESSCDETAAAVVHSGRHVMSNIVATQHELHEEYAGVVPEIASRAHLERILPVVREAMRAANVVFDDLHAIAVGHRPGLVGSLLVGATAAKAIAWSSGKTLVGVDHVAAHLFASELDNEPIEYPAVGLVVSGGHTSLYRVNGPLDIVELGHTIDDAVGEAFDKAAAILELGYPGGPAIDRAAMSGDDGSHEFPIAQLGRDSLDFSFSGLKTALLYAVRGVPRRVDGQTVFERDSAELDDVERADFAASFQRAAVTAVMRGVERAIESFRPRTLCVGGGVSANSRLRSELMQLHRRHDMIVRMPEPQYCVDQAAMIAGYAAYRVHAGQVDNLALAVATDSALPQQQ